MNHVKEISRLLGGPAVLGTEPGSLSDFIGLIRQGLPFRAFETLARVLGMDSEEEGAQFLGLETGTLDLRRREQRILPVESERLVRLARVTQRALHVLVSQKIVIRWLRTPNASLGGVSPLSMLDTDVGTGAVEEVLGRIEYGVFS